MVLVGVWLMVLRYVWNSGVVFVCGLYVRYGVSLVFSVLL